VLCGYAGADNPAPQHPLRDFGTTTLTFFIKLIRPCHSTRNEWLVAIDALAAALSGVMCTTLMKPLLPQRPACPLLARHLLIEGMHLYAFLEGLGDGARIVGGGGPALH